MNYLQILALFISFLAVVSISFFLYKGWLNSALLSRVTKAQTYSLMRIFLYAASVLALTAIIAYAYIITTQHSRSEVILDSPKNAINIDGIWALKSTTKPTKYPIAYLTINGNLPATLWKNHWLQTISNLKIDNNNVSFDSLNRPKGSLIPYTGAFDGEKLHLKRFDDGFVEELIGTRNFDLTKVRRGSKKTDTYEKSYHLHSDKNGVYSLALLGDRMPLPSGGFVLSAGSRGSFGIKSWDTATTKPLSSLSTFENSSDGTTHRTPFFKRNVFQERNTILAHGIVKKRPRKYKHYTGFDIILEDANGKSVFMSSVSFDIFKETYKKEAFLFNLEKNYPFENKKIYAVGTGLYATLDKNNSIIRIKYPDFDYNNLFSIPKINNIKTININNDTTMLAVVEARPPSETESSSQEYLHLFDIEIKKALRREDLPFETKKLASKTLAFKTKKLLFDPQNKLLAFMDAHNNHIILWDISTHSIKFKIPTPLTPKTIIAFSNDGKRLASVNKGVVSFWNLDTGSLDHTIDHGEAIGAIDFSVDDRLFATGSKDSGTITVWSKQ